VQATGRKIESDIHPLSMKELTGNMRYVDVLPAIRTVLKTSLISDTAKWYMPIPEKINQSGKTPQHAFAKII